VSTRAEWLACAILTCGPAHCRRRKIRCLLAEGDSQDRCQNCIRLKKECVFYPVDQQQMLDTRSQSGAKSGPESIPSSAVSPSPPELASGRPFERSRQYGSFPSLPSLPSNAPPGPGFGIPLGHGSTFPSQGELIPGHPSHPLSNHESVGMPPVEYGYQHTSSDGQRQWEQVGDLSSPSASMNRARDSMLRSPATHRREPHRKCNIRREHSNILSTRRKRKRGTSRKWRAQCRTRTYKKSEAKDICPQLWATHRILHTKDNRLVHQHTARTQYQRPPLLLIQRPWGIR
jgi:hypothetical protein